jgi:hypothetical protein
MVRALDAVIRDELRHTRLCTLIAHRLAAPPPQHDLAPVKLRLSSLPQPRFRLASLLLVEAAIGETLSMALFRAGRRTTTEPLTRSALTSIVIDEVRHARLGWEFSVELWPMLDARERTELQAQASRGLAAMEHQVAVPALRRLDAGASFAPKLAALGVLSPEARVEAFYTSVEHIVLPRLDRLGLDGRAAWNDRYQTTLS